MIDFFSLFIQEAIGFGFRSIFNAIAECFVCGQRNQTFWSNMQTNHHECSNCYELVSQYTNACQFTVNKQTGEVGHAAFVPAGKKWEWHGNFFTGEKLHIPYYIKSQGLRGRSLILDSNIEDYKSGRQLTSHSSVLNSNYNTSVWENHYHYWPNESFKDRTDRILIVKSKLVSSNRDIVFEDSRIIKPWK